MGYVDTFRSLAEAFQEGRGNGVLEDGLVLHQRRFRSSEAREAVDTVSPGELPVSEAALEPDFLRGLLHRDDGVEENLEFPYRIVAPSGCERSDRGVLLLHGLNERRWEKYLPWAKALAEGLGAPIVLFPVAFHMDRSPALWSEPRPMRQLSRERLRRMPELEASSFANAALSTRLHARPERFVLSGLRTSKDLARFSDCVRQGQEPLLAPDARLDFFAYSIGAFLAEVLLMGDAEGRFAASRLVTFCGGCVLARTSPLSREILDSAAALSLHRFLDELEAQKQLRPALGRLLSEDSVGRAFQSMVHPDRYRPERETALQRLGSRMVAISFQGDRVMPSAAVAETLSGSGAHVEILAPPYDYEHSNPFPVNGVSEVEVERAFSSVFGRAVEWLNG